MALPWAIPSSPLRSFPTQAQIHRNILSILFILSRLPRAPSLRLCFRGEGCRRRVEGRRAAHHPVRTHPCNFADAYCRTCPVWCCFRQLSDNNAQRDARFQHRSPAQSIPVSDNTGATNAGDYRPERLSNHCPSDCPRARCSSLCSSQSNVNIVWILTAVEYRNNVSKVIGNQVIDGEGEPFGK
jgi:hypothetical protein